MSYYVTRLSLKELNEEEKQKLMEALEYCRLHDKTGEFNYMLTENAAYITSKTREQALKRGYYFKKKHKTHFSIIKEV